MSRLFQVLSGVLLGLGIVAVFLVPRTDREPDPVESWFLQAPYPAPALELHDPAGRVVTIADFHGRAAVLFFGFTNCPDVCPLTLSNLARALELMDRDADRVQVAMISVDPGRDSPERLGRYVAQFHPTFLGLGGDEAAVEHVAGEWGVFVGITPLPEEGGYAVDHTARAFVVDANGRVALTLPPFSEPEAIARALRRLLAAS